MNAPLLIAKKDLRGYFTSPLAYVILAAFLFVVGWMFYNLLTYFAQQAQGFTPMAMGAQKPTVSENILRPLYGNVNVLLLFVAPFITMRLLAEERRDHTVELLVTAPIRSWEIVAGKFLAGTGMLFVMVIATLAYPLILSVVAHPDWGVVFTSYVGLVFLCATYAAIGIFWSSCTENQVIAAVLTFGTAIFFWLISWAAHSAGPVWSDVLTHLSLIGHYTNFAMGIVQLDDFVYYASFTGFALFLTHISVEAG